MLLLFVGINAYSQSSEDTSIKNLPMQYRNVGPSRGGRVTAVAGVSKQENIFYMGATGGGLWKSIDYGIHWKNVSDGYFETPSIGAIAVFEKDPDIIYVGTGSDGIRSNVIVGKGMYKSTDAGKTWFFSGLKDAGQIGSVIIHPENQNKVFAAVMGHPFRKSEERGIYFTNDGGKTWKNMLFLSDSVGAIDLEFAPGNPDIIYAAMWRAERKPWTIISGGAEDGIFKSTDGGETWERKTQGLPTGLIGKIDFAVSADMSSRVWAIIQASDGQEGLYRSDNYAEIWTKVEMPPRTHTSIMYRPFYFTNVTANPQNADNLWSGTKIFWRTFDGGESWESRPATHSDHHDLWINPLKPNIMIEGNDGGAAVTRDGGQNWSTVFNQPTAELYTCDVDDRFPYYLYSGQQDNSTICVPSWEPGLNVLRSNDNHGLENMMYWERVGGCETGPAVPKPGDPNIVYANCKGQFSVFNRTTGLEQLYYVGAESLYGNHPEDVTYRFQRVSPIEVSPHDPDIVYYGSQYLHKTINGGRTWETISPDLTAYKKEYRMRSGGPIDEDISGEEYYAVIYAIQESPLKKGLIWTGSNDGLFYLTRDGGENWENVSPDMPPGGRVSNIEASPHDPAKAYYAVYRDYLGDEQPYIYKTEDYGKSWTRLTDGSNGIPSDYVTRVVREDPNRQGLLYAGTEFGIFISFDDGKTWKSFQRNLPITPVSDLNIIRKDLAISTMGRSFWIMDDISPLLEFNFETANSLHLFTPKDIYRGEQNIHFTLPGNPSVSTVTIEFWEDKSLIYSKEEVLENIGRDDWGIYKSTWDLRHYLADGQKEFRGPMVAPGKYTVRMKYDGQILEQTFNYEINPELEISGTSIEDLHEQEELSLKVAKLLVDIRGEIRRLENEITTVKNKKKNEQLTGKLTKLQKGSRRYDKPMLHEHVEYLYEMVSDTPQKLGEDAFERYDVLMEQWNSFKE